MTKLLAYFLPGFHEDELNNKWWGEGFSEWENVKAAMPLFNGHIQPVIPLDGYYDLMKKGELERQFKQIKDSGLDGIVIYDYWSKGVRPLKGVIEKIKENTELDVSFSICWANHPWTKSWKNKRGSLDVLMEQEYEELNLKDAQYEHYAELFSDERYIKINDRPFFQIYKPEDIPNLSLTIRNFKEWMLDRIGVEPHVSGFIKTPLANWDFIKDFDSLTIGNPTACMYSPDNIMAEISAKKALVSPQKYIRSLPLGVKRFLYLLEDILPSKYERFDYDELTSTLLRQTKKLKKDLSIPVYGSIFVGFDNTPRYRDRAKIVENVNDKSFENALLELTKMSSDDEIVFINAWNEWGEGMALEPAKNTDINFIDVINKVKRSAKCE